MRVLRAWCWSYLQSSVWMCHKVMTPEERGSAPQIGIFAQRAASHPVWQAVALHWLTELTVQFLTCSKRQGRWAPTGGDLLPWWKELLEVCSSNCIFLLLERYLT